ncbi:MAG TPA: hypothetical protein VME20_02315 [Acidimicrobiales bacterium]|nr:hypothetical protein [Acidimicrobiales bacterium]
MAATAGLGNRGTGEASAADGFGYTAGLLGDEQEAGDLDELRAVEEWATMGGFGDGADFVPGAGTFSGERVDGTAAGFRPEEHAFLGLAEEPFDNGDLPVHLAAATVLTACPHPLSELEVAVVLETCGYNHNRVQSAGAGSLMELAREVYALVPVYSQASRGPNRQAHPDVSEGSRWRRAMEAVGAFSRGLLFAAPLLASLTTMLVVGTSFWSSRVELYTLASALTLFACIALICTGPFIYAFVRRGSFYMAFRDSGMLAYVTRRALGMGMLVSVAFSIATYVARNDLASQGSPAANRLGLAAGISIAALQVGLSPFYLRNTLLPMLAVMGSGATLLVWHVTHLGAYVDPVYLAVWQVREVAFMAVATWLIDAWWVMQGARPGRKGAPARRLWLPSGRAVARAVAPYAAFGFAYFLLVAFPQLVSGGAWLGRYNFNGAFSLASGVALVCLVPVAGFGNVVAIQFTNHALPAVLAREPVAAVEKARSLLARQWRAKMALAVAAGLAATVMIDLVVPKLAYGWLVAHGMAASSGLLYMCTAGFLFLSIGTFASQLLFGMSAASHSVVASLVGAVVLVVCSLVLSISGATSLANAAAISFLAGCAVFATLAVAADAKAFSRVDFTCYRAL